MVESVGRTPGRFARTSITPAVGVPGNPQLLVEDVQVRFAMVGEPTEFHDHGKNGRGRHL